MAISQANYNKILQQFRNFNYDEQSTLHERELKQTLDTIVSRNTSMVEFNPEVGEQLWTQCDKESDGTVKVRTFISVVCRAQSILKENIAKAEGQLSAGGLDDQRRRDLQESLGQYHDDLKLLSLPFSISLPAQSRMSQKVNASYSRVSHNQSGAAEQSGFFSGRSSGIFATVPSKRESSSSLKITFIITIFLFLMELIVAFNLNSFFNLLVYIAIFSIVLMGYFDKYYMRFIIFILALSIVLDLIWIIVLASPIWNPTPPTTESTIQTPWVRFQFAFVIILMVAKVILTILFFRYRNNEESERKRVTFFGNTFEIDGRVKENNPVSRLLSGRGIFGSSIE